MRLRELTKSWPLMLMVCLLAAFALGCDDDDEVTSPEEATPTPIPSPSPTPTDPAWGYVSGHAEVMISGLPFNPAADKEAIWCLGNPGHQNWIEVRHRMGSTFQFKGGVKKYTGQGCEAEQHYSERKPMSNGLWTCDWDNQGNICITSPTGDSHCLRIYNGHWAFQYVAQGNCGGYSPSISPYAVIDWWTIEGEVGRPTDCPY